MPKFTDQQTLPFTAEQLFAVVSDVEKYPDFLPWCVGSRIYNQKDGQFDADVIIGFKAFREKFTSRVTLVQNKSVKVDYIKGPMKVLYNHWEFTDNSDGSCQLDFDVDFTFKSFVLEKMIGKYFETATRKMMKAFIDRAHSLYS